MFRRILVAFDDSPPARLALEQAFDLARAEHVESVTVLSVLPPTHLLVAVGGQDPETLREQMRGELERALAHAVAAAPDDISLSTQLVEGLPGTAVLRAISAGSHDLVIMGSRGRGSVASALLGSVSGYVVQHAEVAVLVLHAPHGAGRSEATEERAAVRS